MDINNKCSANECNNTMFANGLCNKHYLRKRKHGDENYEKPSPEKRFIKFVEKSDGCWMWTGAKNKNGRPVFWDGKRQVLAYRFSYEMHLTNIPNGMLVCHSCDNPSCVNPDHLFIGTQKDNMSDMSIKGRKVIAPVKGSAHGRAKVNEKQVMDIRRRVVIGDSNSKIAQDFGINHRTVSAIKLGRIWTHIKEK